jgi:hypothetical protein
MASLPVILDLPRCQSNPIAARQLIWIKLLSSKRCGVPATTGLIQVNAVSPDALSVARRCPLPTG